MSEAHRLTPPHEPPRRGPVVSGDLDGNWSVERTGGLLPPLLGVTKRIHGSRGETRIGRLPGVPFVVAGHKLRYVAPFGSFVDRLQPKGDGFAGTATFRGRAFGRFDLRKLHDPR